MRWTLRNIDKVCSTCLIPVRVVREEDSWELYARGARIDFEATAFASKNYKNPTGTILTANDIYSQIRKVLPDFQANAFLGGTEVPDAPKWLFCNVVGTPRTIFGNMGPKAMETLQNGHHYFSGRFLSFLKPGFYSRAKVLFPMGIVDKDLRRAAFAYLLNCVKHPLLLFKRYPSRASW